MKAIQATPTSCRAATKAMLGLAGALAALMLFPAGAEAKWAKGPVYGTVKFANGRPAAGVRVRAFDRDSASKNDFINETRTDANGKYTIRIEGKHWDPAPHNVTTWRPDVFITVLRNVDGEWVKVFHSRTYSDKPHRKSLKIDAVIPVDRWIQKSTGFNRATHAWRFKNPKHVVCWPVKQLCKEWTFCGGMSLSALSRFRNHTPIPTETSPSESTLKELQNAQLATLPDDVWSKFMDFVMSPTLPHTVALHTIGFKTEQEIPALRRSIDAGIPIILGLIRVGQSNIPDEVFKNHQVLATGYRFNEGTGQMLIDVYDSNYPSPQYQGSVISLHTRLPQNQIKAGQTTGQTTGQRTVTITDKVRGFFVIPVGSGPMAGGGGASSNVMRRQR